MCCPPTNQHERTYTGTLIEELDPPLVTEADNRRMPYLAGHIEELRDAITSRLDAEAILDGAATKEGVSA